MIKSKLPFSVVLLVLGLFLLYFLIKNITSSVFLKDQDKINVVFYGNVSRLYSTAQSAEPKYLLTFSPGAKLLVPGGYGYYNAGALNKLVNLEKDPDLFKKIYSAACSCTVDLYFYPRQADIFYDDVEKINFKPSIKEIFLNPSNATIFDRMMVFFNLVQKNNSYRQIEIGDDYDRIKFNEDYQGIFYKKSYRETGDNVQIIYAKSYETATLLSSVLDGEGIRVVDLTLGQEFKGTCEIVARSDKLKSKTVIGLRDFFHCSVKVGEPTVSDIIMTLGQLEKDWSTK